MPIAVLEDMTQFINEALSINTPRILVNQFSNIYNRRAMRRSIVTGTVILVTGGLGVPLFIKVPEIHNFVSQIIHPFLPFASGMSDTIIVGFMGFWIMGAIGFNALEFIHKNQGENSVEKKALDEFEEKISDEKIEEIIDANPHMYSELRDASERVEHIIQLKEKLKRIRDKAKSDVRETKQERLNSILESALEKKDLLPLLIELSKYHAKRRIKLEYSQKLLDHIDKQETKISDEKAEKAEKAEKEYIINTLKYVIQKQKTKLDTFKWVGDEKFQMRLGL